jgi:ATP-binding cassette subfamily F protein 3
VTDFSGGWRIRLNLAQALMCPSDILLLDEPTNHLDLDAVVWLENWLKRYPGTLLLISHDRDFIDGLATHVMHFESKQLLLYTGNYSQFEIQRASRLAQQAAAFDKQQQRIAEIHGFVSRFGAKATKARQAQSRLKELERMELIAPAHIDSPFHFSIPCSDKMSEPLLVLKDAALGYGDTVVLGKVNLNLSPGSRLGLLGANGQGKSTLVKTLAGEIPPLSGQRTFGEHLKVGYFSQHQLEALDERATALEQLQAKDRLAAEQVLRNFLGGFGFGAALCDKPVAQFSGGERARLALALIAWQKPNLLLLDEPTNHLDLDMRHALNVALQAYPGALILVSHDRHLMRALADDFIWVHQGKAEPYEKSLDDYERDLGQAIRDLQVDTSDAGLRKTDERKQRKRDEAALRQQLSPLKKKVQQAEKRLEQLALQLRGVEELLASAAIYEADQKDRLKKTLADRQVLQAEVQTVEDNWLGLHEELESLQAQLL